MDEIFVNIPNKPVDQPNAAQTKTREGIRQVAEEFEAMFISEMLRPTFSEINKDSPFGGGYAGGVYQSMAVDEYGKQIVQGGSLGIADMIEKQLLKLQEVQ